MRNLRYVRELLGLTVQGCAVRFGVSPSVWASWEDGTSWPSSDCLVRICKFFSVSLDFLIRGDPSAGIGFVKSYYVKGIR